MASLWIVFGCALITSGLLAFPVRNLAAHFGMVDRPNMRSSHHVPTPRGGGIAIVLAVAFAVPWFVPLDAASLGIGMVTLAVAIVSFLDDIRSLSFLTRL